METPVRLTLFQKSACEALWRRIAERGEPSTSFPIDPSDPNARAKLAAMVLITPQEFIPHIVLPEIQGYGRLRGGYSARWAPPGYKTDEGLEKIFADKLDRKPHPILDTFTPERGNSASSMKTEMPSDDEGLTVAEETENLDAATAVPKRPRLGRRIPELG